MQNQFFRLTDITRNERRTKLNSNRHVISRRETRKMMRLRVK